MRAVAVEPVGGDLQTADEGTDRHDVIPSRESVAVDDGRTGLLVRPNQPSALADGLCRLMADPALAARLGDAARDAVRTRYSFNRMVDAFERVYLTELARRCGGVEVEPPRRVA